MSANDSFWMVTGNITASTANRKVGAGQHLGGGEVRRVATRPPRQNEA
jgi:hypothetical protein